MGLRRAVIFFIPMLFIGCAARKETVRSKVYIDCCNPALGYNEKDMCKWAKDNPGKRIHQGNTIYETLWSDCRVGGEPWKKWE